MWIYPSLQITFLVNAQPSENTNTEPLDFVATGIEDEDIQDILFE